MAVPFTNRITLDALRAMPVADVAALPADLLALLQDDSDSALAAAKSAKDRLDDALALKYAARTGELRRQAGKDTGTVRLDDGDHVVIADLPKRVRWDQSKLAALVAEIRAGGDDPAEYLSTEFKVSERAYTAWPSSIRDAFAPARTVETGKPSFRIEPKESR